MLAALFGTKPWRKKKFAKPNNAKKSANTIGKGLLKLGVRQVQYYHNISFSCIREPWL